MAEYRVKFGWYEGVTNEVIKLPDDLKLITGGEHDIGPHLHNGHCNYLGCVTNEYWNEHESDINSLFYITRPFGPYTFIMLHDIKFIDNPPVITVEEFNKKWEFSKFRIAYWSENYRLMCMYQILDLQSEFIVNCLNISNRNLLDNGPLLNIGVGKINLTKLLNDYKRTIVVSDSVNCYYCWDQLAYEVLKSFNPELLHAEVDIFAAHKLAEEFYGSNPGGMPELMNPKRESIQKELDDYLNFRKIKYITN